MITGIRGVPGAHGGFETFATDLAPFLTEHGWDVTVFCQESGFFGRRIGEWNGVRTISLSVPGDNALSTIIFDFLCLIECAVKRRLTLTLGYNTAVFNVLLRLSKVPNIINMDGIEWKRAKWGRLAKIWFQINERAAGLFCNHFVADNPHIKTHLSRFLSPADITMIPYGADKLPEDTNREHPLDGRPYLLVIARPEPENSILEIVRCFAKCDHNISLLVMGDYQSAPNAYQRKVLDEASDNVIFLGAIYDRETVENYRRYASWYVHGHQVGGTNPSLVESLACGNAIIAHGNKFNRWVAGDAALYFESEEELIQLFEDISSFPYLRDDKTLQADARYLQDFTKEKVLHEYLNLLNSFTDF